MPATPGRRTPFGPIRPAVLVATGYALVALVWVVGGDALPGGCWLAVHLFTLGVVTNLVVALTHHFAQTLMHAPDRGRDHLVRLGCLNAGALLLLTGLPAGRRLPMAVGATAVTASVLWLRADLRRARRAALPGRFAFVVLTYERACSLFIIGGLLGGLMGTGVVAGTWYDGVRAAHLHLNVLGWGGVTLLATIVFFGPTVMRARMESGADDDAARWLRRAIGGLAVGASALLLTGLGDPMGPVARLVAAGGLAVYATGVAVVCTAVIRTGRRAAPTCTGRMLQAACCWFIAAAFADVLVIASGQDRLLDAVGTAVLVGVLGQTILATLGYLVPMAWAPDAGGRASALRRMGLLPSARPLALNAGVVVIVLAAASAGSPAGSALTRIGWTLVAGAVGLHLVLLMSVLISAMRRSTTGQDRVAPR